CSHIFRQLAAVVYYYTPLPIYDSSLAFLPILLLFFFLQIPRPPTSTLFPYTTLFRSLKNSRRLRMPRSRDTSSSKSASRSTKLRDRKSTRLNSSHGSISYAVFCLKKKKKKKKKMLVIKQQPNKNDISMMNTVGHCRSE